MIRPRMLRPGDPVALVAPAGPVTEEKIEAALQRCRDLGLEPVPGASIRARTGYLAGQDALRATDLRTAIADGVGAIWALRGGYGTLRTLEHVDLTPLVRRPRPFIGFSDNTAVLLALHRLGVVAFHGPHAGADHFTSATIESFRRVLMTPGAAGTLPRRGDAVATTLIPGAAEGPLVGGNLALMAATCGTRYQPETRGAILFLEDVGEPLYRIDRMLAQLRLAGVLEGVAGIALGEFSRVEDAGGPAGRPDMPSLEQVLAEILEPLGVPTVLGLPFGHGVENWTLPLGVRARLDADAGTLELLEPATTEDGDTA